MKVGKIVYIIVFCCLCAACATTKNTQANRGFHAMKVRYNIFYNGNNAYYDGLRAIQNAHTDDYTQVIPLYPVSDHAAAESSASQMDMTIEKCRKAIKLHSIKAKPKPNPKKKRDPKYQKWLQQEEFNRAMPNVWVRLGEAEFHKGDFIGSIGTFTYVVRHFDYDPVTVVRCQLMMARAYAEMGWSYEAEDCLNKVSPDVLPRKYAPLYAAATADVLMKADRNKEAIPFIKIALPAEKRKIYRPRVEYVLAQLHEQSGNKKEAVNAYKKVIRMAPPADMDFNARIHKAQLQGKSSVKPLLSMTKQGKYKDRLDQLYGAIGTIYLQAKDTAQALAYYQLAIEKSTQSGMPKAQILVRAGDLYYEGQDYASAQPCYSEAVTILSNDHNDYARVLLRSETLEGLVREYGVITLQDSLQHLSTLSADEQMKVAELQVANLIAAEQKAEEDARLAQREADNMGLNSVNTDRMFGMNNGSGDWYFYNQQLIKTGSQTFRKIWGSRVLEDNWRRASKSATAIISSDLIGDVDTENTDTLAIEGDTISLAQAKPTPVETDPHKPEYYLQQIPSTPEALALSDSLIADAYYNLIFIYKDEVLDTISALVMTDSLASRFPNDPRLVDVYYAWYLTALKNHDIESEMRFRNLIIGRYPESAQAKIVADPAYFDRLRNMAFEQDSLYEATYEAYSRSEFKTVMRNTQYAEENYPLSMLLPRFLFLDAVATARTQNQDAFIAKLKSMVSRYPDHTLSAMAKDFLAMMGQGLESQQGAMTSDLAELRGQTQEEETTDETPKQFTSDTKLPSYVLIATDRTDEETLHTILYEVAVFNFSQFLIRDFDLKPMPVFADGAALRVCGFESLDEAIWYMGLLQNNVDLMYQLRDLNITLIPVTEPNMSLLQQGFTVKEYFDFLQKSKIDLSSEKVKK